MNEEIKRFKLTKEEKREFQAGEEATIASSNGVFLAKAPRNGIAEKKLRETSCGPRSPKPAGNY